MATSSFDPVVLEDINLESFIQYLLDKYAPSSTLIVCSSKEAFTQQLQTAVLDSIKCDHEEPPLEPHVEGESTATNAPTHISDTPPHRWTIPTLRLLASAQTLELAFCEDVTHLRAFLAAYPYRHGASGTTEIRVQFPTSPRVLAILNPITLHRHTSNFSAQGLNRTFSVAVDAAHASGGKLLVAECGSISLQEDNGEVQRTMDDGIGHAPTREGEDVWDEAVSILNVATKNFGSGERGWVGRTVKLKAVAERWCAFDKWRREAD